MIIHKIILNQNILQCLKSLKKCGSLFSKLQVVKRNLSTRMKDSTLEKFRVSDKLPDGYELVYRSTMSSYLTMAQTVTTIAAIGTPIVAFLSYDPTNDYAINLPMIQLQNITEKKAQLGVFSAAFIGLNLAMIVVIGRFPIRMYFNAQSKRYVGFVNGIVPNTKKAFELNAGELVEGKRGRLLPWNEYSYKTKDGNKLILLDHYFRRPEDLNTMLGYSKL